MCKTVQTVTIIKSKFEGDINVDDHTRSIWQEQGCSVNRRLRKAKFAKKNQLVDGLYNWPSKIMTRPKDRGGLEVILTVGPCQGLTLVYGVDSRLDNIEPVAGSYHEV